MRELRAIPVCSCQQRSARKQWCSHGLRLDASRSHTKTADDQYPVFTYFWGGKAKRQLFESDLGRMYCRRSTVPKNSASHPCSSRRGHSIASQNGHKTQWTVHCGYCKQWRRWSERAVYTVALRERRSSCWYPIHPASERKRAVQLPVPDSKSNAYSPTYTINPLRTYRY